MRITNPRILAAGASLVPNRAMYSPEILKKIFVKWKLKQICTTNFYPILLHPEVLSICFKLTLKF